MTSRVALFALAAVIGFAGRLHLQLARLHHRFRWANNSGYVTCVRGVNQRAQAMRPQMRGAYVADGTSGCNRILYGHN